MTNFKKKKNMNMTRIETKKLMKMVHKSKTSFFFFFNKYIGLVLPKYN